MKLRKSQIIFIIGLLLILGGFVGISYLFNFVIVGAIISAVILLTVLIVFLVFNKKVEKECFCKKCHRQFDFDSGVTYEEIGRRIVPFNYVENKNTSHQIKERLDFKILFKCKCECGEETIFEKTIQGPKFYYDGTYEDKDVEYYIEQYFRLRNIRFISVTENYDSNDPDIHSGILLPLRNMINEAYALDISRKIKAQQRQAMKDGKYLSIIESPGVPLKKWQRAPEIGPDVWKIKLEKNPLLVMMDGKNIAKINNGSMGLKRWKKVPTHLTQTNFMSKLTLGDKCKRLPGMDFFVLPKNATVSHIYFGKVKQDFWPVIAYVLCGWKNGYLYLRFVNGDKPENHTFTASYGNGFTLRNVSYINFRDLFLRGSRTQFLLSGKTSHVKIENCLTL